MVGLILGTASSKHDLVHLPDNSDDRKAEMTASTKQIANRNQAPKCAKMDTHCVKLLVSRDRWSLGQRLRETSTLTQCVSIFAHLGA